MEIPYTPRNYATEHFRTSDTDNEIYRNHILRDNYNVCQYNIIFVRSNRRIDLKT